VSGLRLARVEKAFDGVRALAGVDLEAVDGELLVVLGPSGCGKSTLLRAIAGLEAVDAGSILIGARDVTGVPPGRRNVSMVFQSYALFPHLTAAENIGFGLEVREVAKREVRERVAQAAKLVGCEDLLARRPAQLSGGERQRVALARALVREPDVFLLDEPLSNLDAELRVEMRAELKALHARVGATMVYVTHDQTEALTLGDRIAVMRAGTMEQVGTPDEVWRRPVNRFVARFVGSPPMNVIADGHGRELGIRPEHVRLGESGQAAEVTLVEPIGSEAFVHLLAGGLRLIARVDADARPAVGDTVHVALPVEHRHHFDVVTGERIDP
jgi:ABC-type sugar transport system ATPase subunit